MARVHEPGNTTSPALNRTPKLSTLRASHATAVTGLPSTASLRPSATTSPLLVRTASIALMSMSDGATRASPSTKPADDALSAMVSQSAIFQSVIRVSINSIEGTNASVALEDVLFGAIRARQVMGQDETDLDLHPRVQVPVGFDRDVLKDLHLVEQVAVVGFVDTHHLLHRQRREADLVAYHPGALSEPLPDVDQLDFVRVDDVDLGMPGRQRCDRLAAPLGLCEIGGERVAGGSRDHLTEVPSLD